MKKIGQVLLGIIILVILIVVGYILFMTVTDYKPEDKISKIFLWMEAKVPDHLAKKKLWKI